MNFVSPISEESLKLIGNFQENRLLVLKELYLCDQHLYGCDLVEKLNIPKNLLSYHIGPLKELGIIEEMKCGRKKQYQIASEKKSYVKKILEFTKLI